ncbi:MAG: TlpA family protein disulfide reductase [Anaerolineaceae bacterium]|nr:TlpA family protein disulfide reductase [Anaerolineaceae bacterium]MCB9099890.1 TlpA family protein disulfide reductase [Anaerolineales bacterium]
MSIDAKAQRDHKPTPFFRALWFWMAMIGLTLILGGIWIVLSKSWVTAGTITADEAINLEPAAIAGHPAPNFELVSTDGETVKLSDFKGQPVILNFWATWCGPCRSEFPEFQQAAVDNADRMVIIGINNTSADNPNAIPDFMKEFGITFPILLDTDREAIDAYNVLGLPTTIFIDDQGVVNEVFTGPLNKAYIESKISELIKSDL